MRLVLEVISGPNTGQRIIAQAGETVSIGRTPKAAVALEDTFMSGEHFTIECVGGACGVRDLKSRNGTKVNGVRVNIAVLHDGDTIHAGQTEFAVHVETGEHEATQLPESQLKATLPPSRNLGLEPTTRPSQENPVGDPLLKKAEKIPTASPLEPPEPPQTPRAQTASARLPTDHKPQVPSPANAIQSYEAATPAGVLLRILQNQPEPLMALVDAARDRRVLELLHESKEEYRSLYKSQQDEAISPLLLRLPPQSSLLKQMVHEGWGRRWGVYLTCRVTLVELREYFRQVLMVSTPDGVELFSRFYDPRFFRGFLDGCTSGEAQKFFGPISAYLMEAERPEILLEFRKSSTGTQKKGHLLTSLE
ncbi:MAG TPA: DUF4123 domain-containing protein [Pyrinomonadaceae bacterium]|nr:DUF4123 domain-containing protein [Pyrinomonadaceae bacterium]